MIKVEEVKLNATLPNEGIGIVAMQPFVELCSDDEPFRWQNNKKGKQIERIIRTLEIAEQRDHGCERTHFTIFPEYSIPGLEGVQKIQETLRDHLWKDGAIVIGGIDGLAKDEYSTLCSGDTTQVHEKNKPEEVRDDQWVNCCIVWVKTNGLLKRWVQPKLSPSWPERNITNSPMFVGRSVYVFSGKFENQTKYRFLSLICFDLIGQIKTYYGIWAVFSAIDSYWRSTDTKKEMNLVFILQFNPKPNHHNFLENARDYFEIKDRCPFINRNEGIILFANTAGGSLPGKYKDYGYSSLISSPTAPYDNKGCPPTFALTSQQIRGTDSLGRCKEALFREMGACIHSFKFRLPSSINLGSGDRCWPIDEAIVYAIDDGIDDARAQSRPVPASVKWTNDQLDGIGPFRENERVNPLKNVIKKAHEDLCEEIRRKSGEFLCKYVVMSSCEIQKEKDKLIKIEGRKIHNVDNWDESEEQNLKTIVYSLSIMKVCRTLEVTNSLVHATMKIQDRIIDIIVVSGETHEKCSKYAKSQYMGSDQRLVIVVTRDIDNTLREKIREKKFKSIFESEEQSTEKDPNITDPDSRFNCCGYQNLLTSFSRSKNLSELNSRITEVVKV